MPRAAARLCAALCYLGALRVPLVAFWVPQWAFTLPIGLLITGLMWFYARGRSPFLLEHARTGLTWTLQANGAMAAIAVLSMLFHWLWQAFGVAWGESLWNFGATLAHWAGFLVSLFTTLLMVRALRGRNPDTLST